MGRRDNAVLDALGDPTRRRLLRLLSERPHSVEQLARKLPVTRPAVSHHLKVLRDARLVNVEAKGTRRVYELDEEGLKHLHAFVDGVWGTALSRFKVVADNAGRRKRRK
jgi:DNA-binding transcriptional ArsR family regulator